MGGRCILRGAEHILGEGKAPPGGGLFAAPSPPGLRPRAPLAPPAGTQLHRAPQLDGAPHSWTARHSWSAMETRARRRPHVFPLLLLLLLLCGKGRLGPAPGAQPPLGLWDPRGLCLPASAPGCTSSPAPTWASLARPAPEGRGVTGCGPQALSKPMATNRTRKEGAGSPAGSASPAADSAWACPSQLRCPRPRCPGAGDAMPARHPERAAAASMSVSLLPVR